MAGSISYFEIRDQVFAAIDSLWAETDPIKRLVLADLMQRELVAEIRKVRNDSAYSARLKHSSVHIETASGIDRKRIRSFVAAHLDVNPQLKNPSRRANSQDFDYIDLRNILKQEQQSRLHQGETTPPS